MASLEMADNFTDLVSQTEASAVDARVLSTLVERLEASACRGIADKLSEYKTCGPRANNLIAELRMALAIGDATGLAMQLQARDAHDLRLCGPSVDCTIEVEHKSSISAFADVFYPDPGAIAAYGRAEDGWKAASFRLHKRLKDLAFELQPWIDGKLSEPRWDGRERARQEDECGYLAE
jgi:hypothetical protein